MQPTSHQSIVTNSHQGGYTVYAPTLNYRNHETGEEKTVKVEPIMLEERQEVQTLQFLADSRMRRIGIDPSDTDNPRYQSFMNQFWLCAAGDVLRVWPNKVKEEVKFIVFLTGEPVNEAGYKEIIKHNAEELHKWKQLNPSLNPVDFDTKPNMSSASPSSEDQTQAPRVRKRDRIMNFFCSMLGSKG